MATLLTRLEAFYGGATFGRAIQGGLEGAEGIKKWLYPLTSIQVRCARAASQSISTFLITTTLYQWGSKQVTLLVTRHYGRFDKPLQYTVNVTHVLQVVVSIPRAIDPTPYSESFSYLLNDVASAARDGRQILTLPPNLLNIVNTIVRIANEEIATPLRTICNKKLHPDPIPPPTTLWGRLTAPVWSYWERKKSSYTAPLYKKIPEAAEKGVEKIAESVRAQIETRRQQIEQTIIPKATDVMIRKAISTLTFIGINVAMSTTLQRGVDWIVSSALSMYDPELSDSDREAYQRMVALPIFYTYHSLILISYTARLASWRKQRVQTHSTAQFLQDQIPQDQESVLALVRTISDTFKSVVSVTGRALGIDIAPLVDTFEKRCATEISWPK